MHELADQVLFHVKATWRYRWYAVVIAWIIASGGWIFVYLMPDRYEAYARVYVDTQSVLRPLLSGLAVQPNVDQMVAMMGRTLVSRLNMEKVIRMADMDIGLKTPRDREQVIARLIRNLSIRSTGRENLYTIVYADENPQHAQRVVQALVTIFVEESFGDKRKDSDAARRFIDEQLKAYNEKLVAAENAVTAFKRRHQGLMPGDGRGYYARLSDARIALRQATLELKEAENSRDAIKKRLAGDPGASTQLDGKRGVIGAQSEIDIRIQSLEQKLDGLRLTYTELHPDIVALVRTIAQLKEQKAAEEKMKKPLAVVPQGPAYQQLTVALATAEANVAAMKARVAEYGVRLNELQAAANALPQIEAEYTQLTRDYEVIKVRYDKLLERRESAQISGDVEASDVAMGFRVIDPAKVPLAPTSPNRLWLMTVALLAALGGGLGVAFLMSQLRPTFNDERRLKEVGGLPVLGTIAMAWTEEQKKRRTRGLAGFLFSFLSLLSAYLAIMVVLVTAVSRG
jgi:polysaccharide chain length determinant protein (PEP-CTERM system associated)